MIDLHSHVLPGLDDGPKKADESVAIIRFLSKIGFTHIVCTPHFRVGMFENTADRVRQALEDFQSSYRDVLPDVKLIPANEVHLDSVFREGDELYNFLTIGESEKHVLLEAPIQAFPYEFLLQTIDRLFLKGIHVILAHPEKHHTLFEKPERYEQLSEQGVKFQVNITSLAGYFGRKPKKAAELLLKRKMVFAVGSDAHNYADVESFVTEGLRRAAKILGREWMTFIEKNEMDFDWSGISGT